MAKLKILYDADDDIEELIKNVEKFIDLKHDGNNIDIKKNIQLLFQTAFDEGRKFQKQLGASTSRDTLLYKSEL